MLSSLLIAGVALAAVFDRPLELTDLAARSEAVVQGVVVLAQAHPVPHGLSSTYTVVVDRVLWGEERDEVTVVLPGGRLEGLVQRFDGVPLWDEGDEVVIFVPAGTRVSLRGVFTVEGGELVDPLRRAALPTRVQALVDALGR